jgi:hypothetical protein
VAHSRGIKSTLRLSDSTPTHFVATTDDTEVFSVSKGGDFETEGILLAAKGTFLVTEESVTVSNSLSVGQGLTVGDGLSVDKGVSVGGELEVEESVAIRGKASVGDTLAVGSSSSSSSGAVLSVSGSSSGSGDSEAFPTSMISVDIDGVKRFHVDSDGKLETVGMRLYSGGVQVDSGGLKVMSGGILSRGGLTVEAGGLSLPDQSFSAGSLRATRPQGSSDMHSSLLALDSKADNFAGSVIELSTETHAAAAQAAEFSFVSAKSKGEQVFRVSGEGTVHSSGGAHFLGGHGLHVESHSSLAGGVSFSRAQVKAGAQVSVPTHTAFVQVLDDGEEKDNILQIGDKISMAAVAAAAATEVDGGSTKSSSSWRPGQVLIISNLDQQPLQYLERELEVPPGATVMLLFDGANWSALDALNSAAKELSDINEFTITSDVYIGNYTLGTGQLQASSLEPGRLVVGGTDGLLVDFPQLTFAKGVLNVPAIKTGKLLTNLDARGNQINHAVLVDASITSASEITMPTASGMAFFEAGTGRLLGNPAMNMSEETGTVNIFNLTTRNAYAGEMEVAGLISAGSIRISLAASGNRAAAAAAKGDGDDDVLAIPSTYAAIDENGTVVATSIELLANSIVAKLNVTQEDDGNLEIKGDLTAHGDFIARDGKLRQLVVDGEVNMKGDLKVEKTITAASLTATDGSIDTLTVKDLSAISTITATGIELAENVVAKNVTSEGVNTEALVATQAHVQTLTVNATADFAREVYMEEGLTVQGSVMGSGPYIDSSDGRFKRDVVPVHGALDMVSQMQAVTYNLRSDEFPDRNFDRARQLGWIADDLESVVPELVTMGEDGYRSVAYGRSAALIAAAVRELREEMAGEVRALKEQVRELQARLGEGDRQ